MEKQNSKAFYVVKAFAIFSVVFAHCSYPASPLVQQISALLGTIGVPIFLISAGVFFNRFENGKSFWLKKLKNIVCPWVVFGILTYFVFIVGDENFRFTRLFLWTIGSGTWLYFVTILLICYAVFKAIKWKGLPYLMIALFIVSNILDVFGINPISNLIGPYLNVFTRVGYFAVGILLREASIMKFKTPKLWIKFALSGFSVATGVLYIVLNVPVLSYFVHLIFVLSISTTLFFWSQSLAESKLLQSIGKQTYFIYFVHMQFGIGILNRVIALLELPKEADWGLLIIKPLATLFLMYGIAIALIKIMSLLKLDKLKWIIGLR